MIVQLLAFKKQVTPELHSLVLMGTGEPLLNYENVIRFLHMIHGSWRNAGLVKGEQRTISCIAEKWKI